MGMTEKIILQDSGRGMELLAEALPENYCENAAGKIKEKIRCGSRVLLATGFYVKGHAETDGPPGTLVLARAMQSLGCVVRIVTDEWCRGLFEPEGFTVSYISLPDGTGRDRAEMQTLLQEYGPEVLIAVERCGRNIRGDYANMRGASIAPYTARLDWIFEEARRRGILTAGIGDGGNEIGMGRLRTQIEEKLLLCPCRIETDCLIVATVSNWGAYGLAACLTGQEITGRGTASQWKMKADELAAFIRRMVELGCVDGVSGEQKLYVDGFPMEKEIAVFQKLQEQAANLSKI